MVFTVQVHQLNTLLLLSYLLIKYSIFCERIVADSYPGYYSTMGPYIQIYLTMGLYKTIFSTLGPYTQIY